MKQFDYQFLYNSWYRQFPNVVYWTTLSIVGLAALIPGIILCSDDITAGIGACIIIFGLLLAFGAAFLSRWITAILLSQKIIATDALLAMQNGNVAAHAAPVEEELPEL